MKLSVSIYFPAKEYKEGVYSELIEELAKKYNSTGSVIWFKDDLPCLHCIVSPIHIENLILDCYLSNCKNSKNIDIKISHS